MDQIDLMLMLEEIFQVCIIPLLGVLTAYLVTFIKKKTEEIKNRTDNELYKKYMDMLQSTVIDCVIATNQTYVDALKNQNAFTPEAQQKAFEKTSAAVMTILSQDAKEYLNNAVGDLNIYVTKLIEAQVKINKIPGQPVE